MLLLGGIEFHEELPLDRVGQRPEGCLGRAGGRAFWSGLLEESLRRVFSKSLLILRERDPIIPISWVAVKELNLNYYIGETLLFTIYTHYGNLI